MAEHTSARILTKLKFKSLKVVYATKEKIEKDTIRHYHKYLEEAHSVDLKEEPLTLTFSFDFHRKELIINEAQFLPLIKAKNQSLSKLIESKQNFVSTKSSEESSEIKRFKIDLRSLYTNIIAKMNVERDPYEVAYDLVNSN